MRYLIVEWVDCVVSRQGMHFLDTCLRSTAFGARFGALEQIGHLRISEASEGQQSDNACARTLLARIRDRRCGRGR